jgi:hypothetical protein
VGRFLGSWDIDDVVRVHIQTSSVTTGAATDADAAPSWRVYEDDTATPVTTGSFSTLNAQVGFYVAAITLASAIGYEVGKSYAIRTQATVGGVIGADVHSFQIQSEVRLAAGAITAGTITAGALQGFTLGSVAGTVGSVAAAVTVGSTSASAIQSGLATQASVDTIDNFLDTEVAAILAAVDTEVSAILADTNEMQTDWADGGRLDLILDGRASQTSLDTLDNFVDTEVAAIKAVTDLLPDAGALSSLATQASVDTIDDFLDTEVAAIKAKTDLIFAGTTGSLAVDIRFVNGVSITGNGQSGTEWGPGS